MTLDCQETKESYTKHLNTKDRLNEQAGGGGAVGGDQAGWGEVGGKQASVWGGCSVGE